MFADQVGKIGGVDAMLGSFTDRRQIEAGDEVTALIRHGACSIEAGIDGDDIHGFTPA
jgi:hypothetical protein